MTPWIFQVACSLRVGGMFKGEQSEEVISKSQTQIGSMIASQNIRRGS